MKESLKFLNRISKIKGLEPENYYSITITKFGQVYLQGYTKARLLKRLKKFMPDHELNKNNGFIEFKRGKLLITLT